ncbi:hypothetical protein [Chryseobacterium echinoideorum]|uniref:hypothetical protein n=1 Tax=Chryseobacterium echinoideorum TaxID=1549648 RepID=UPI001185853C|nr:hypothetical protein [Chryseobacterium echinoideorum]
MKKKLFLRLCLTLAVGFSAFSCRTEEFHNEEETHGNAGLRLTSQRISLSQAKHRTQLLPDLEKAETAIEKKKLNVQGKSVNIGNGITIDTDEVIYMENGPDYHTYTFSVIRDNAPANAPVENILMTPNTGGSYRVFHIVLNLTEGDKAKIANREYVDYKNKQQVTELAGINLSSLTQKQICVPHYYSYPVSCKEGLHEPGEPCAYAGTWGAAYWGSIVLYDCFGEEPETFMPTPIPIDGGGGGGGVSPEEGGQNPPYECTSAATDPTQVGLVSPTGCYIGMPSEPIVRPQTPCSKIKAKFEDTKFKEKYNELNKPENFDLDHEKAFIMRYPPIGTNIPPSYFQVDMPPCSTNNEDTVMPSSNAGLAGLMHTHTNTTCSGNYPIKVPSPVDIKYLLNTLLSQANQYTGSYSNAYSITITSEGSYMLMYTGTNYPGSLNYDTVTKLKEDYTKAFQDLYSYKDNITQSDIEKLFTKFMKEKINKPGLEVYRVTPTSAVKLEYDPNSPNSVKQTPCP